MSKVKSIVLTKATEHNQKLINKAVLLVAEFESGVKNYTVIKPHGHLSIQVGRDWRLLSKDGGNTWCLMSHEKYNKDKGVRGAVKRDGSYVKG